MKLREQLQTLIGSALVRVGLRLLGVPADAKFAGFEVVGREERPTDPAPKPDEDEDRAPFEVVTEKSFAEPEQREPLRGSLADRVRAARGE